MFRCCVPVLSFWGWSPLGTGQTYVPAGDVVYLEMQRLLFGEAWAITAYCCMARTVAVVIAKVKVLGLPMSHYIDDFLAIFWPVDQSLLDDSGEFIKEILKFELHVDKFAHGLRLLFLGLQLRLSPRGFSFCLSNHRWQKYVELLHHHLSDGQQGYIPQSQAAEVAPRLSWSCNALFGRCGRAFLALILRRTTNPETWPQLNRALCRALKWWCRWLQAPARDLTRFVPDTPRPTRPPAVSYTDASTEFRLGAVLPLPVEVVALFFCMRIPTGEPIDWLEAKAAGVGDAVFGPIIRTFKYVEDISFVDNNVSLSWLTSGCSFRDNVDPLLAQRLGRSDWRRLGQSKLSSTATTLWHFCLGVGRTFDSV